jgi:DNA-binding transcriptional LysR family regulator
MDLNLLVAFEALWVERSVTRAGRRLGLSQPAMSGALARLRAMFGDELFVRDKAGLAATERCDELAPAVSAALTDLRHALESRPFDAKTTDREFVVGAVDAAVAVIVPGVVRRVTEQAPNARVSVVAVDPQRAAQRLLDEELDLALVPVETAPTTIASRVLFPIGVLAVMRREHPLAKTELTREHLTTQPMVVVSFAGTERTPIDEALAKMGAKRRIAAIVDSFLAVPYFLETSDAIAILPSPFALRIARGGAFVTKPVPLPNGGPTLRMRMLWSVRQSASSASRWLRDIVILAAKEAVGGTR